MNQGDRFAPERLAAAHAVGTLRLAQLGAGAGVGEGSEPAPVLERADVAARVGARGRDLVVVAGNRDGLAVELARPEQLVSVGDADHRQTGDLRWELTIWRRGRDHRGSRGVDAHGRRHDGATRRRCARAEESGDEQCKDADASHVIPCDEPMTIPSQHYPDDRLCRSVPSTANEPPGSEGSGSRGARIHTSCAVVVAPTLDRAFARWCFTVECDRPSRWAAAFSDPATRTAATTPTSRSVARPALAGRPARHALRSQSNGSGGSASRIVIGRSLVAGLSLSPRPNLPHRRAAAPRGRKPSSRRRAVRQRFRRAPRLATLTRRRLR